MQRLFIRGKHILVKPPKYPSTEVKDVLGGRYNGDGWLLQPTSMNVLTLVDFYGKEILDGAPKEVQNLALAEWGFHIPNYEALQARCARHPKFDDLYDFQKTAVEYIVSNPHHGALLALSPGLGKAPVSCVAMDLIDARKVLIIAPLTLAKNWQRELNTWTNQYRTWSRATPAMRDPVTPAVIVNHELLMEVVCIDEYGETVTIKGGSQAIKRWREAGPTVVNKKTGKNEPARKTKTIPRTSYHAIDWDLIIVDESVLLKNRKAVKVDLIGQLAAYAKNVWLLSGSPTAKFRTDLYPQVKTIMPRGFSSYWRFADFFSIVERGQWGWKITGDRPDHDPKSYLRDFMFIRDQSEVLPELPDYIYEPIEIELNADQRKAFKTMTDDWYAELSTGKVHADIALAQMTRLSQITSNMVNLGGSSSSAKEDLLVDLMKNADIEFPLLVWTWWIPTTESIAERLEGTFADIRVGYVHGKLSAEEKDEILEAYRDRHLDVLILQMGVGKFGHTFTDTRTVYYHDRHFDSDAYFQTLRRVKRIGLTHRPRLIVPRAPVSADPAIELNLSGKLQSIARLGNKDLRELLASLGHGSLGWSIDTAEGYGEA